MVALAAFVMVAASGAANAAERKLSFAVRGVVAEVMVRAGQTVKAGDPLARLDLRIYEARKKAAVAALKAADNALEFATQDHQRVQQLFDDLSTSGEELEKMETAMLKAGAEREKAFSKAESADWRLQRATLRAPSAGTVKAVPGFAGMVVQPHAEITTVVILSGK